MRDSGLLCRSAADRAVIWLVQYARQAVPCAHTCVQPLCTALQWCYKLYSRSTAGGQGIGLTAVASNSGPFCPQRLASSIGCGYLVVLWN
jgi:hypothetical protein